MVWKALGCYASVASVSSTPTSQSDIAGSAKKDYYDYHVYAQHLKPPVYAATMRMVAVQVFRADFYRLLLFPRLLASRATKIIELDHTSKHIAIYVLLGLTNTKITANLN